MPEKNKRGYDIEISKGPEKIAVQVKNYKRKCNLGQLTKFIEFLDLPIAAGFTSGIFVSSYGFSRPALTSIESEEPGNLSIATCTDKGLEFHYRPAGTSVKQYPTAPDEFDLSDDSEKPRYFGVFTCKGGVGKTTVSAHLAGAMALQGYDVALLDLDPDQN